MLNCKFFYILQKKQPLLSFETLVNMFLYELIKIDLSMNID